VVQRSGINFKSLPGSLSNNTRLQVSTMDYEEVGHVDLRSSYLFVLIRT